MENERLIPNEENEYSQLKGDGSMQDYHPTGESRNDYGLKVVDVDDNAAMPVAYNQEVVTYSPMTAPTPTATGTPYENNTGQMYQNYSLKEVDDEPAINQGVPIQGANARGGGGGNVDWNEACGRCLGEWIWQLMIALICWGLTR